MECTTSLSNLAITLLLFVYSSIPFYYIKGLSQSAVLVDSWVISKESRSKSLNLKRQLLMQMEENLCVANMQEYLNSM
jgi:hypothetical protein